MLKREARFLLSIYVFISQKIKQKRNIFGYKIRNMTTTLKTKSKTYKLINTFFTLEAKIFLLKINRCNQKIENNRELLQNMIQIERFPSLKSDTLPLVAQKNSPTSQSKK